MRLGLSLSICQPQRSGSSGPTFDPATLALTSWVRGSFSASPWVGEASAGASLGNDYTEATNPPAAGAAVDGYTPADFDGSNDLLSSDDFSEVCLPKAAYALAVMFKVDTAAAADANVYNDPGLVGDAYGLNIAFSDSGFGVAHYNAAWKQQRVACSAAAWHVGWVRFDTATGVEFGIDNAALTTIAASTGDREVTSNVYKLRVGRSSIVVAGTIDGQIMEVMTMSTFSDAERTNLYSNYFKLRYPGASLP
jgi:hypothetical protein